MSKLTNLYAKYKIIKFSSRLYRKILHKFWKGTIKGIKFHQSPITEMAIAKNKNIIATGGMSNEIAISNAETGNVNK